jgi:hypothetical protein
MAFLATSASRSSFAGVISHQYPEEVFVVTGGLYEVFDGWFKMRDYATIDPVFCYRKY